MHTIHWTYSIWNVVSHSFDHDKEFTKYKQVWADFNQVCKALNNTVYIICAIKNPECIYKVVGNGWTLNLENLEKNIQAFMTMVTYQWMINCLNMLTLAYRQHLFCFKCLLINSNMYILYHTINDIDGLNEQTSRSKVGSALICKTQT